MTKEKYERTALEIIEITNEDVLIISLEDDELPVE